MKYVQCRCGGNNHASLYESCGKHIYTFDTFKMALPRGRWQAPKSRYAHKFLEQHFVHTTRFVVHTFMRLSLPPGPSVTSASRPEEISFMNVSRDDSLFTWQVRPSFADEANGFGVLALCS